MSNEFVNPNYHVILVHYPIGLLVVGTVIEAMSFLWRRGSVRTAGRWMIGIGALSMLPAAASGIYALADVARVNDEQWAFLTRHAWLQSAATLLAVGAVTTWVALSDRGRARLHWPLFAGVLLAVGLTVAGAWYAGEAVYRHGTGVATAGGDAERESAGEADGEMPASTQPDGAAASASRGLAYVLPPLQAHMIAAGFSFAVAFGAIGLAYRRINRLNELDRLADEAAAPLEQRQGTGDGANAGADAVALMRAVSPTSFDDERPVPAGRFWAVAAGLAVVAMAFGWWYLARESDAWAAAAGKVGNRAGVLDRVHALLRGLLLMAFDRDGRTGDLEFPRRAFHVVNGVGIVVLMLVLAALARWGGRRPRVLTAVVALLLLSLAAQVWLGVLMTYEGAEGPVTRWGGE